VSGYGRMPIDRRRRGTRTVGITHGHEENGSVEIKKAKAVRGGRGKEEEIEVME
jgi:hypothetical protein